MKPPHNLINLVALSDTFQLDLRYATAINITGRVLYPVAQAFLAREPAAELLKAHQSLARHGFGIRIWDTYRPYSVSKILWESTPTEQQLYVANPESGSIHNRGCAVDLTLYSLETGAPIEMPSDFDDFSESAWPNYKGLSPAIEKRRQILHETMTEQGFHNDPHEWWHYNWNDWQAYPVLDIPIADL